MASDGVAVSIPTSLVQGSQGFKAAAPVQAAPVPIIGGQAAIGSQAGIAAQTSAASVGTNAVAGGQSLPRSGNVAASSAPVSAGGSTDSAAQARTPIARSTAEHSTAETPAAQSTAAARSKTATVSHKADVPALVAQLNKYLNNSGRPAQFRVDPNSSETIQEINPASGAVIGEFSATEFPALARSLGVSGVLVDARA